MRVVRGGAFFFVTSIVAGTSAATVGACHHGDYDGSYDGSYDSGAAADGSTRSSVVQPSGGTAESPDRALEVTFAPGTFAAPATITITTAGEQTIDFGLVVPIYLVTADQAPSKFFQVAFNGNGNGGGGTNDNALAPALQSAAGYKPLAIAGTSTMSGGSGQVYWGLTKTFGTFSLFWITGTSRSMFTEVQGSCTATCCPTNNSSVSGSASGCYCPSGPDLNCFLTHCPDLEAPAARCAALAAANNSGAVECLPFKANCQAGSACMGYSGTCGNGTPGVGGPNNYNACCVTRNGGSCAQNMACLGFAARCTKSTPCPADTKCCVFESESYCAKDCPAAQLACDMDSQCADGGAADAGTCQGGRCPVGVCGTPPMGCRP